MIIKGNTVGHPVPATRIIVGDVAPGYGPALWFNTAPGGAINNAAVLLLDDNEDGSAVQVAVEDETYGVKNATVNQSATAGSYDFTVL